MRRTTLACVLASLVALVHVASAAAEGAKPAWSLRAISRPTNLAPGSEFGTNPNYKGNESDYFEIVATNSGAAQTKGTYEVKDTLPTGITPASVGARIYSPGSQILSEFIVGGCEIIGNGVECSSEFEVQPDHSLIIIVPVAVSRGASESLQNVVTAEGGGAEPATMNEAVHITTEEAAFGLQDSDVSLTEPEGGTETTAGAHPYELTTTFDFNTRLTSAGRLTTPADVKNVELALPPGLIGDPTAVGECPESKFQREQAECPENSQIGVATVLLSPLGVNQPGIEEAGIYNLVPRPGVPAEFGFNVSKEVVLLTPHVRGSDYGLTTVSENTPQTVRIFGVSATIWGSPSAASHDAARGNCYQTEEADCKASESGASFLRMPTSCGGSLDATLSLDSWQNPTNVVSKKFMLTPALNGCNQLAFGPTATMQPEVNTSDTATGLTADVKANQEDLLLEEGLATADLKNTKVVLPVGVVVNPGEASGLTACALSEDGVGTDAEPSCPGTSQIGTAEVVSPLLRSSLRGSVYVLESNPPEVKLLVAVAGSGVNVKLVGDVHLNEANGQLVTTFENAPQLPFTDFKLIFAGGAHAALVTPAACGTYTSESDFAPWSSPAESDTTGSNAFAIESGPNGTGRAGCSAPLPFAPTFVAGSTATKAGAFTSFTMTLRRVDGQQRLSSFQFTMPKGLLGMISNVPLCPEPEAAAGTCSASSQIGHTAVEAGPGEHPLVIPEPGRPEAPIYLTGGYRGAPYGLSIAVPALAGPFNLGTIVVRAAISVNPYTSQVTITTDPLPTILKGVPTDLRTVSAVINRPNFIFDPTNCTPQTITGTAISTEAVQAQLASQFDVTSCKELSFAPKLSATTSGKTSRVLGASLSTKLSFPTTVQGTEADISLVKVTLPKQLPARDSTLKKACLAAVFEEDPANCPSASLVGHATVHTPVLPSALTGPAYYVSHGGAEFPSLEIVLQGEGVTIDLVGSVLIRNGITTTTFKTVPDVPFANFELSLPKGEFSGLGAYGNLCREKLVMPTTFVAQNGAESSQSPRIAVTECGDTIKVISHKVQGRRVTVSVAVPSAGTLSISGISGGKAQKTATGRETLQVTLAAKQALPRDITVYLRFSPTGSKKATKRVKTTWRRA